MIDKTASSSFYSPKNILIMAALTAGYLLVSYFLIGFHSDQLFLVSIINLLFFISRGTRSFIISLSAFIIFWIVFNYMKAFPNYNYSTVHIEDLYNFDKRVFGVTEAGTRLTQNEYWFAHRHIFLDVLCSICYLLWIPGPLALCVYFFFTDRKQAFHFSYTFLLVNFIGFVGYYVYPAAPPWYVQLHGFSFQTNTPGYAAGFTRVDNFFHIGLFNALYSKSSNVFAAMPSLHSSYPLICLYFAVKNKLKIGRIFFLLLSAGIWFAAVYSGHHYVSDVLAGIFCAIAGILLYGILIKKKTFVYYFIEKLAKKAEEK
ncbi:MAG: phosphatase PAP2 family protein [Chitinophagaceae bacterium]|jgi:membrane-associated phospholipid phosphatase|nr:phosphatase PAP2 family protein [Chitinophagaceae bacterium]